MSAPLADEADALRAWADGRFGPLGTVRRLRLGPPEPPWWYCGAELARVPLGNRFSQERLTSGAAALDPHEAVIRAIGEGIERYSALTAPISGELATLREGGFADRWPVCAADEPCPPAFRAPPLDTPLTQIRAQRLSDGSAALVPASIAHLHFRPTLDEPTISTPISTGLAFGRDTARAIWSGLCEVAERDAIMAMWWLKARLPEIDGTGAGVPEALAERLALLTRAGLQARLFDMAHDFRIPSVFCVLIGPRFPFVVVGAGCDADPTRACIKAIDETIALRYYLRDRGAIQPPPIPQAVQRLEDHALYYASGQRLDAFSFLLDRQTPPQPFAEFAAGDWWQQPPDMAALAQFATERECDGLTALWLDLTGPDTLGLGRVVKVIVPEMLPMSADHATRWLGTSRLLARAGHREARAGAFNPDPHPFP